MKLNFIALSIASLCPFVNAQEAPKTASESRQNTTFRELTFDEFVAQVLETGRSRNFNPGYAKVVGVPSAALGRGIEVGRRESADDLARFAQVILAPASPPQDHKPIHLHFGAKKRGRDLSTGHEFRTSLTGVLEKAYISRGKLDDKGKNIRGSGVAEPLNINSPEVKKLFQRELDFWLKGKGRKQPGVARVEKTPPAKP